MKQKSLKRRWPYFFGQRIHGSDSSGTMPELIKPESELPSAESGIEDILRWADDGGKMLDPGSRTPRSEPPDADRKQVNDSSTSAGKGAQ